MTPRNALAQAKTLLGDLFMSPLESVTTSELVRLGADLWTIANQVKTSLETIKDLLRTRAPAEPGQHLLAGPGASCMVTVQTVMPILRKGVPVADLREILAEDFDLLFEVTEVVVPRGDFEVALQRVGNPERVQVVLAALDIAVPKPRVSFQLKAGSEPSPWP